MDAGISASSEGGGGEGGCSHRRGKKEKVAERSSGMRKTDTEARRGTSEGAMGGVGHVKKGKRGGGREKQNDLLKLENLEGLASFFLSLSLAA